MNIAIKEIKRAFSASPAWAFMGWFDIIMRYRRTALGPIWMVLATGLYILVMGVVGAGLFKQNLQDFFPYLTVGLVIWLFLNSIITEGSQVFVHNANFIRNLPSPILAYPLRLFVRNLVVFGHNLVVVIVCLLFFQVKLSSSVMLIPLVLVIYFINSMSLSVWLGIICCRFRDIPQLINSVLSVMVFVTPIIWKPEFLGNRQWVVQINPFTHFIEILRSPLIGLWPSPSAFVWVLGWTLFNVSVALFVLNRCRHRIPYWA